MSDDASRDHVSDDLHRLADAYGVATTFVDQSGATVQVAASTIIAVLAALDVDATSAEGVASALERARLSNWRRMIPPVFITITGQERRLWVHVPHGRAVSAWLTLEDGSHRSLQQMDHWVDPMEVDGVLTGEASFRVPGDLPLGWHTVTASTDQRQEQAPLVVTPQRLDTTQIGQRQWGLMCQVYTVRSRGSWGLGDLHDAGELARWSAEYGAGFLAMNPVHAANLGPPMTPSPYLPTTRRFTNPIYLRIEDIPEYRRLNDEQRRHISALQAEVASKSAHREFLDRDSTWQAKAAALQVLFGRGMSPEREAQFAQYCREEGSGLRDFATWMAIAEDHGEQWRSWPIELQKPDSPAVAAFRHHHAERLRWYCWLQWLMDEQLGRLQSVATDSGMPVGIIHDLAVGVHPDGADAWSLQQVLAQGVAVGAPPDMYNQAGQNWSQPPWRPDALAESAFIPYRDMLRTVLRHAGGLRIDHALGLFRMWWIPDGATAAAGTYVRFDHDALLGILCLEAQRAGALVIGEDLGTLEPWVQEALANRGLLGTSILWFESDTHQVWNEVASCSESILRPRDPAHWRTEVLASVGVHDLPPTAGYLRDEHVRLRHDLGLLVQPYAVELAAAATERQAWVRLLVDRGWWPDGSDSPLDDHILEEVLIALHRALAASPARLIGVNLPDLVGDRRAQNQPGTDQEYPNWRVPMTDGQGRLVMLEDLLEGPLPGPAARVLAEVSGADRAWQ